jgi:hypothetical protein
MRSGTVASAAIRCNARVAAFLSQRVSSMPNPTMSISKPARTNCGKSPVCRKGDEFWHEAERELKDGAANDPDEKSGTFLE